MNQKRRDDSGDRSDRLEEECAPARHDLSKSSVITQTFTRKSNVETIKKKRHVKNE